MVSNQQTRRPGDRPIRSVPVAGRDETATEIGLARVAKAAHPAHMQFGASGAALVVASDVAA